MKAIEAAYNQLSATPVSTVDGQCLHKRYLKHRDDLFSFLYRPGLVVYVLPTPVGSDGDNEHLIVCHIVPYPEPALAGVANGTETRLRVAALLTSDNWFGQLHQFAASTGTTFLQKHKVG